MREDNFRSPVGSRSESRAHDDDDRRVPEWLQLAQSYVLYQRKHPQKTPPEKGLRMGTIFYELYQPWEDPWKDEAHDADEGSS